MLNTINNFFNQARPYIFPAIMVTALVCGSLYKYPMHADSRSEQRAQRTPEEQHKRNTQKSMFGIFGGGAAGGAIVGAAAGGPWAPLGIVGGGLVGGLIARGVRKNKERRNGLRPVAREQSGLVQK